MWNKPKAQTVDTLQHDNFIVIDVQGFFINNIIYAKMFVFQSVISKIKLFTLNQQQNIYS